MKILLLALVLVVVSFVGLVGAAYYVGSTPEDVGQRLRRECEAIIREAYVGLPGVSSESEPYYVQSCIIKRGTQR